MAWAKYRKSDGQFLTVVMSSTPPDYDNATEGLLACTALDRPDIRTERWTADTVNFPNNRRPATAQEMTDERDARRAAIAQTFADADPMVMALAEMIRREVNDVRADVRALVANGTAMQDRTVPQIVARFKAVYQAVLAQLGL